MTALRMPESHQSLLGAVLPGCWKLQPERAVTLHPQAPGVLRVAEGRIWATLAGPHHGPANDWGDVVLRSGEQLRLLPGQQLVVESYGEAANASAWFSWEPLPAATGAVSTPEGAAVSVAADAGREAASSGRVSPAAALVHGALQRAGLALLALGEMLLWLVPRQGAVLPPLERNQP